MFKRKVNKGKKTAPVRQAGNNKGVRKSAEPKPRTISKQSEVIGMLSRPQGVTILAIMKSGASGAF